MHQLLTSQYCSCLSFLLSKVALEVTFPCMLLCKLTFTLQYITAVGEVYAVPDQSVLWSELAYSTQHIMILSTAARADLTYTAPCQLIATFLTCTLHFGKKLPVFIGWCQDLGQRLLLVTAPTWSKQGLNGQDTVVMIESEPLTNCSQNFENFQRNIQTATLAAATIKHNFCLQCTHVNNE